jgi:hypothetical protein
VCTAFFCNVRRYPCLIHLRVYDLLTKAELHDRVNDARVRLRRAGFGGKTVTVWSTGRRQLGEGSHNRYMGKSTLRSSEVRVKPAPLRLTKRPKLAQRSQCNTRKTTSTTSDS